MALHEVNVVGTMAATATDYQEENLRTKRTQEQISRNMKAIKSKGTKIEICLMKELWSRGLRYRKNVSYIFGKPDIVFMKRKIAVFCDSEFWHGYNWEKRKNDFKSNREFWISKIERNIERDKVVQKTLEAEGWTVIRFWGKEIEKNIKKCADIVECKVRENG